MIYNRNVSGYRDPTAGEALRNITRDERRAAAKRRPAASNTVTGTSKIVGETAKNGI